MSLLAFHVESQGERWFQRWILAVKHRWVLSRGKSIKPCSPTPLPTRQHPCPRQQPVSRTSRSVRPFSRVSSVPSRAVLHKEQHTRCSSSDTSGSPAAARVLLLFSVVSSHWAASDARRPVSELGRPPQAASPRGARESLGALLAQNTPPASRYPSRPVPGRELRDADPSKRGGHAPAAGHQLWCPFLGAPAHPEIPVCRHLLVLLRSLGAAAREPRGTCTRPAAHTHCATAEPVLLDTLL